MQVHEVVDREAIVTAARCSRPPASRLGRQTSGRFAEACLEALPGSVVLVDDALNVLFANGSGRELLGAGVGVRVSANRVQLTDPDAQRLLAAVVLAMLRPGDAARRQRVVLARRPMSARPLRVAVLRMDVRDAAPDYDAPWLAALLIDDPDRRPLPTFETLRDLYGVTAAEARLAFALYNGETIDAAAGKFGVSTLTVRTQLKSLFSRMGVHSQSQLVRELGVIASWPFRATDK